MRYPTPIKSSASGDGEYPYVADGSGRVWMHCPPTFHAFGWIYRPAARALLAFCGSHVVSHRHVPPHTRSQIWHRLAHESHITEPTPGFTVGPPDCTGAT